MPRKIPTITLVLFKTMRADAFKVLKVTDTVEHLPGQVLDGTDVAVLCRSPKWKVTIVGKAA